MDLNQLIEGCKNRDKKAQIAFVALFSPKMRKYCLHQIEDYHDSEEVMMDGFYKCLIYMHRFEYRSDNQVEAWIMKIMSNQCKKYARDNNEVRPILVEVFDDIEFPEDITSNMGLDELLTCVEKLPPKCKDIFTLFCMYGMTHEEIARRLNIHIGTSLSHMNRARKLLKDLIIKYLNDHVYSKTK